MGTIGIEWVNKYHGHARDLKNRDNCARGFYHTLDGIQQFEYGDDLSWDQDFEESGVGSPTAGTDQIYVDNVDIVYFAGHGNSDGPTFGVRDKDSGQARHSNMRLGDRQIEWIVFDACSVLDWNYYQNWQQIFRGLHGILGFRLTAYDSGDRGKKFAKKLNEGETIIRAWIEACEETEADCICSCLFADQSDTDTFNDHWYGKGYVSPDPTDPTVWGYYMMPC